MDANRLHDFIDANRDELIRRCRAKVAARPFAPEPGEIEHGIPEFLGQLIIELRAGASQTDEIAASSARHGRNLLYRGLTVSQVVRDYGDICQSVTDLALTTNTPIATEDFRTLNRCLDDAIAGAVAEHVRGQQNQQSDRLRDLTDTAIAAFEAIRTGAVATAGRTSALLLSSLLELRARLLLVEQRVSSHSDAHASAGPVD